MTYRQSNKLQTLLKEIFENSDNIGNDIEDISEIMSASNPDYEMLLAMYRKEGNRVTSSKSKLSDIFYLIFNAREVDVSYTKDYNDVIKTLEEWKR